jgi:hypothetical protein
MGFLDKLKPQPRWKNADPVVRLDAIKELDDSTELGLLAESDPDVRVRRAALARVTDPAVLGRILANDADAEARDRAADRLVAFATRADRTGGSAADPASAGLALDAARELTDVRRLSTIAKSDAIDAVRAEALSRVSDERALGSIARQARHESTAAAALARLTDRSELMEAALHSTHGDVAIAAFDRLAGGEMELAELKHFEGQTHQKVVARRAKALIQEREQAEAARLAALEERRRRESACCDAMEQVASLTDLTVAGAELARLIDVWAGLGVEDAGLAERFARGRAAAETSIARREREAAEAADLGRRRAEAIATRDALCARVETLDGDDVLEQLVPIEEEWRSLLPLVGNGPEADRLAERFAQAVAACRKRHEMGALLMEARTRLESLAVEAESLSLDDDAAPLRWQAIGREARGLTATLAEASRPSDELAARFAAVEAAFVARDQERQAAVEAAAAAARQEILNQFRHLAERARRASEADTITLREGERLMRDLTAGLDLAHKVPAAREIDEAVGRLRTLQEQIAPRVRELREMDEWRRFANAQRQEQLIAMAEAIVASLKADDEAGAASDLAATARALRELNAKWQEVAEAPRQNAQRLWDRFRTATDFIRARCETHFVKLREERTATLERKTAIVVEAESLMASTEWATAAARLHDLQTEWQTLGPVHRDANRDLSQRFRAACSTFFSRRREDLTDRKKVWSDNLARKEALCERAETLAESLDWDATAAELKRLQNEWKTIGPVRRNKSEQIWNRFRAAADRFFTRYHNRHEVMLAAKLAEREALVIELEALASAEGDAPDALAARVQALRTTWNRAVPIPSPEMRNLTDRWQAAVTALVSGRPAAFAGTDLDPSTVVRRMEKLVERVESLLVDVPDTDAHLSPTELLAARLRSALATKARGGRNTEEARARTAAEAVKDAQASWQRLPQVGTPEGRALANRFRDACRRVNDQFRRTPHGASSTPRRSEEPEPATV